MVQFSHFSVKEFLTSDRLAASKGDISHYHILPGPAHSIMAQACLGVLIRFDYSVDEKSIETFPLARYAATHLGDHAEFEDVIQHIQDGIDCLLDPDKPHFATWLWAGGSLSWGQSPEAVPLYYVAQFGLKSLVKYLISKRPDDVRAMDEYGTPLHAAFQEGHEEISQLLLEYIDVDIQDFEDRTPLHLAAYEGFLEVTRTLVERNADINVQRDNGQTPLHQGMIGIYDNVHQRYFDVIRYFLEQGADVDAQDCYSSTPLHLASYEGSIKAMKILPGYGANVHVRNNDGQTPLHEALGRKMGYFRTALQPLLVQLLLEHGADVNALDNHYWTPLHLASYHKLLDVARLLLAHGAAVNMQNIQGQTSLHCALEGGYLDVAQLLLEHGGDVDSRDYDRLTPLHLSSYRGSIEATQLLLKLGANIHARNNNGETPLQVASGQGHQVIVQLFSEHAQSE
jgi:ankyrin repeat protein